MTVEVNEPVDSAVLDLLEWIKGRPSWHADALVRASEGPLGREEVLELVDKCLSESQANSTRKRRVTAQELSAATSTAPSVTLKQIDNVQNVNRLAADQVLRFAPVGMTVIYGENGTGKSGYTRLLRQVCQVRGLPGEVLPDVYSQDKVSPKARISWLTGDGEEEACEWKQSSFAATQLKYVSVFDSKAADHHIHDGAQAAYTPEPLRLLEGLGSALHQVEDELQRRIEAINAELTPVTFVAEDSDLAAVMSELGQPGTADRLKEASLLSPDEVQRLAELSQLMEDSSKADPTVKLASLRRLTKEAEGLVSKLEVLGDWLSDRQIASCRNMAEIVAEKQSLAKASAELLSGMEIPDLGTAVWKQLWEAARTYSQSSVYPNHRFPHVIGDSRCVLCQQVLGPEAKVRMESLERYVDDTAQRDLKTSQADFVSLLQTVQTKTAGAVESLIPSAEFIDETHTVDFFTSLTSTSAAASVRLKFIQQLVSTPIEFRRPLPDDARWDPSNVVAKIQATIDAWALEMKVLVDLCDEDGREEVRKEHRDLKERESLAANLKSVLEEDQRQQELRILREAISTTKRRAVTQQHGKLSQQLVTDRLQEIFNDELNQLGASRLRVSISRANSANATSTFKLTFDGIDAKTALGEVFSEGECRMIGLARFFTEMRYSKSNSAIVMDDPVSSLDHKFRAKVARRLAAEALERQVVVFTHDIAFLEQLNHHAPHVGSEITYLVLENTSAGSGACSGSLPPYGTSLKMRIGHINQDLQKSERYWRDGADKEWRSASESLVIELRKAWERAIEEVLFNLSVTRFERSVQTNRVREVTVNDSDWSAIENAMTELSRLGPHDEPQGAQDEPASPDDIKRLVEDLKRWKEEIDERRKDTSKRRPKVTAKI